MEKFNLDGFMLNYGAFGGVMSERTEHIFTTRLKSAMERAGINAPAKCRAGGCGFCHSRLVSGKYSIAGADKRRLADTKFGYIHPCCTYPDSDMEIVVPKA